MTKFEEKVFALGISQIGVIMMKVEARSKDNLASIEIAEAKAGELADEIINEHHNELYDIFQQIKL